jgi:hypothetical protein
VTAAGPWLHDASGMEFPQTVSGFERTAIARFSASTPDIAVNYSLISSAGAIDATVYLMHEPLLPTVGLGPEAAASVRDSACQQEFATRLHEISDVDHIHNVQQERIVLRIAGVRRPGRLARFTYDGKFAGQTRQLRSELARFCFAGGEWSVEYRFSYPANLLATGAIGQFVSSLQWTGALASI